MFQSKIVELEQYILGLALSRYRELEVMAKTLTPSHFTVEAHQYIFTSMIDLLEKGDMADLISVATQLRGKNIPPQYLVTLYDIAMGEVE
jgi:replicative DNA helicase